MCVLSIVTGASIVYKYVLFLLITQIYLKKCLINLHKVLNSNMSLRVHENKRQIHKKWKIISIIGSFCDWDHLVKYVILSSN